MTLPNRPLSTLLASAQRITSRTVQRGWGRSREWQSDAWDMFDLVGEHRFLATTLAGRMSQARLFVGKVSDDATEEPVPVEDPRLTDVLDSIGSSAAARSQLIARLGVNLFVAGDGWLAGIPKHLLPNHLLVGALDDPLVDPDIFGFPEPGSMDVADLDWRMLSVSEVSSNRGGGEIMLRLGESAEDFVTVSPDDVVLIRVWRPHPRKWWEADSPTRSSLPVLRELVGLTMHVSAQVDSRLAGAGMLVVPQSAQVALRQAAGYEGDLIGAPDLLTEALMEAMITPIADRSSASAIVPLILTVPDEAVDKIKFIDFAKPLDLELRELRAETIRRLALGLDAPPELLLGTGAISHWGAWLVLEDVVSTHLEPPLALICDALTTQYLWPVLVQQGMAIDEARQYVVWYDVSDLVVRPTRSQDAKDAKAAGAISNKAYRTALGFDDSDAPEQTETLPEVTLALDMVRTAPSLAQAPGIPQLVAQIRAVLNGEVPEVTDPTAVATPVASAPAVSRETSDGGGPESPANPSTQVPAQGPQSPALAAGGLIYDTSTEFGREAQRRLDELASTGFLASAGGWPPPTRELADVASDAVVDQINREADQPEDEEGDLPRPIVVREGVGVSRRTLAAIDRELNV